jgi:ABC-type branched-subunit amino acid transport system permease subunit/MFS family permease
VSAYWPYIVPGLVAGAIYSLLAVGVVLTYTTTGVLNLAFGAQAYISAVIYYDLRVDGGWGSLPAVIAAVLVAAPVVGYVLDRVVFRHLRTAPPLIRLAVSIGMLTALPAIIGIVTGGEKSRPVPPPIIFNPQHYYQWGSLNVDSDQLGVVGSTIVVLIVLGLIMRFSNVGLRMRAVVESGRLSELHGVGAPSVNTTAWIISSILAGLGGVMLAPLFSDLNPVNYTVLLMAALAAAVFGRLRSLPLTLVGALLTGVGQNLIVKWIGVSGPLATGLRPSFPFVFLFVLLVGSRSLQKNSKVSDPMAGVDPPPSLAGGSLGSLPGTRTQRRIALVAVAVLGYFVLNQYWSGVFAQAALMGIVFLSLMLLTGQGGYISLCHAAFVGVGAFITAQLAIEANVPIVLGALIGGLVAGLGGLLLAIPSLRLGELPLALATFGFGVLCENLVFNQSWAFGSQNGLNPPRPQFGFFDMRDNKSFLVLAVILLVLTILLCRRLLSGTTGRFATATRGSETAAASIGINAVPLRLAIFTLSAAMAGFAGGLLGSLSTIVAPTSYTSFTSFFWLVIVLVIGVYTIRGAVTAGVVFVLLPELLSHLPETLQLLQFVLFGVGVVSLAKHPEGALEFLLNTPARLRERTRQLAGGATEEDKQLALERALQQPEPVLDVNEDRDAILPSTPEERLARRQRRHALGIEAAKLRARIPAYPIRLLYLITLTVIIDQMARGILPLVWDDLRRNFGLSDAALGPLNAAFLVIAMLAMVPAGRLSDRMSRTRMVALVMLPWAVAMILQGFAPTFALLFIFRMFLGPVEGVIQPIAPSLLGDYFPVKRRTRVFGTFLVGTTFGLTLGTIIGGAMADSLGWRGSFVVLGVAGGLLSLWLLRSLREPERGLQDALFGLESEIDEIDRIEELEADALSHPELAAELLADSGFEAIDVEPAVDDESSWGFGRTARHLLQIRTFRYLLLGQAMNDAFLGIFSLWILVYYRRYYALTATGAGGIAAIFSVAIVIGMVQSGGIGDRLQARGTPGARIRLSVVARVAFFVFSFVTYASPSLALSLPALGLSGYALGISSPVAEATWLDVVPAHLRGQAGAFRGGLRVLGFAVGPLVLGFASELYGLRQALLMVTPAILLAAVVTAFAQRTYDRDQSDAQISSLRHDARVRREGGGDLPFPPAGDLAPVVLTAAVAPGDVAS